MIRTLFGRNSGGMPVFLYAMASIPMIGAAIVLLVSGHPWLAVLLAAAWALAGFVLAGFCDRMEST